MNFKTLGVVAVLLFSGSVLAKDNTKAIFEKDYGKEWAFNFDRGVLYCLPGQAVFVEDVISQKTYALNGIATMLAKKGKIKATELPDSVWKEDEEYKKAGVSGMKIDISTIINDGLKLCD